MTDGGPRVDARLVVPAVATWTGAALARGLLATSASTAERYQLAMVLAAAAALLGLAVVVVALAGRRRWPRGWHLPAAFAVLGVLAASVGTLAVTAPPVATWLDARATAVVRGVVASEARALPDSGVGWGGGEREVRLATSAVSARGAAVRVDLILLARLPTDEVWPVPGTWVEVTGRLGPTPWRSDAAGTLRALTVNVLASPGIVDRAAQAMRTGLRAALDGAAPDPAALVAGLAVGDESGQSTVLSDDMRAAGLSHLTAVSGGNVAILLAVVLGVVTSVRVGIGGRVLVGLAALAFFVVLVGPQPSVLRAGAMGVIAVVGLLSGGRRAGPSVLGAGVLVLLVIAPWLATSWAFALSAVATAGLILLAPHLLERLGRWPATRRLPVGIREALAMTAAAQLATLPVLVAMGGAAGWVALPANVLVMPVVAPITILGLAAAAVAPVAPAAATILATVAAWPAGWIAAVAHAAATAPLAGLPWPTGIVGVVLLGLTGALVLAAVRARRRFGRGPVSTPVRLAVGLGILLCCGAVVLRPPARHGWPPPGWFAVMCDVGQGDALVLRAGEGSAVVVDAGPDPDAVDRCLSDLGVTEVPAVVLTHFHSDHVDGLTGVLRHRAVGQVLVNPIRDPPDEAAAVDATLAAAGLQGEAVSAGDSREAGDVSWLTLWPRRRIAAGSVPNNASIVLVARVADHDVLLTGDIEPEAQQAIAADLASWSFDVVKVPHHGSRYEAAGLTTWARAPIALISVGAGNDYGHPAPETIAAWTAAGAIVARTDVAGDVAVVSDGGRLGVVGRCGCLGVR